MQRDSDKNKQDLLLELAAARELIAVLKNRETDEHLAKQAIKARELWCNTLLDSLPVGVLLIDPETHRIVDSNAFATKMIGRPKNQLIGQSRPTCVCSAEKGSPEADDPEWQLDPCECALIRSDGKTVPVHKTATLVVNDGKTFILESFVNISKLKQSQMALALDEIRFESLYTLSQMLNESEQVILDYALEAGVRVTASKIGYIYFVNQDESELKLHAWSKSVMSQCSVPNCHAAYKLSETGLLGEAVRQRRPVITNDYDTSPSRRGCPEGHVVVTRHMNLPVEANGKIVLLAGVGNKDEDYTEEDVRQLFLIMNGVWSIIQRKRDDEAIKKALNEARQATANVEVVLRSVADGLIFSDMDNRIVLMSTSAEAMLGKPWASVYFKPIETVIENQNLVEELAAIQSGVKEEALIELELPGEKEGETRTIQAKPAVVRVWGGMKAGIITILRDVSQERHLDRMKSDFIATAAHELRTPLTAVMGFAELLLNRKDLDESQKREFLSIIHQKSEVLGKIIDDFLSLARVDSGNIIRLEKARVDIGSIIGRCTADYQRACPHHHFATVVPEKSAEALVDGRKLFQVMENLLGNAVKFSPEKSLIRVACEVSEVEVRISVSDEGRGMTPDQVAKVFDKFYRVDASNTAKEGLGLGMAIVKSIIEAHNGRIWVESEVGKGTKVAFTLPLEGADPEVGRSCTESGGHP
jgi:signal transduction histidine kinase